MEVHRHAPKEFIKQ